MNIYVVMTLACIISEAHNVKVIPTPECLQRNSDAPITQFWDNSEKLCLTCTKCKDEGMVVLTPCNLFSDTVCIKQKDDDFLDKALDQKAEGKVVYQSNTVKQFLPFVYGKKKFADYNYLKTHQDHYFPFVYQDDSEDYAYDIDDESEKIKMIKSIMDKVSTSTKDIKSLHKIESINTFNAPSTGHYLITTNSPKIESNSSNNQRKEIDLHDNVSNTIRMLLLIAASAIGFLVILILVFLIIKRNCIYYRHPATLTSYSNCTSLDCEMV